MKSMKMFGCAVLVAACAGGAFAAELQVPAGYRATVMPASREEVRFIKPGDKVDMLVTARTEGGQFTLSMLQNVLVLASENKNGSCCLVLALRPNEAQYAVLSLAGGHGRNFVIRAKGDDELHPMPAATLEKLLGAAKDRPAEKKEAPKPEEVP